jgi:hypothetical protein
MNIANLPIATGVFALALALFSVGCLRASAPTIQGSGNTKTEVREVGAFNNVVGAGSLTIVITVGDSVTCKVTADDNLLPIIETVVEGDTLKIGSKQSFSTRNPVRVELTVPAVNSLRLAGSGNSTVTGLKQADFDLRIAGSGSATVDGQVETLSVSIAGSGSAKMSGLKARSGKVKIAGSGSANVHCTESITAEIAGSGDVVYNGNPAQVQQQIAGSGRVRKQ